MNRPGLDTLLPLALLLLGLILAGRSLLGTPDHFAQIERKSATLAALDALEPELRDPEALRALVEREAAGPAADLNRIATEHLGNAISVRPGTSTGLAEGWRRRGAEVTFKSVSWSRIGRFLEALDAQRPRWQPLSVTLQAGADGKGSGTMTLQVLEKRSAPAGT